MSQDNFTEQKIEYISVGNGAHKRDIAYLTQSARGNEKPGLLWLCGFKSTMIGLKANALCDWAKANDHAFTRMDYSGNGASSGDFKDGTISQWLEEALAVFHEATKGKQIIIGSSMGGWIALLMAERLAREERVHGMVLIAPAWDMTERLIGPRLAQDADARAALEKDGFFARPSHYEDGDYIITKKLLDDGRENLIGGRKLHLNCPVHILHGQQDPDVPWQHGQELMSLLPNDDVTFTLIPDANHRQSRDEDLERLFKAIADMV